MKPTKDIARDIVDKCLADLTIMGSASEALDERITAALDAERSRSDGLVEALERIEKLKAFCIMGDPEHGDPRRAFSDGSHSAYCETSEISREALKKFRGEQ